MSKGDFFYVFSRITAIELWLLYRPFGSAFYLRHQASTTKVITHK